MVNSKEYFLSINDVSKLLELPAHTLRYWEKQFPATVKPTTGVGGRRYYRQQTVESLKKIKDLLYSRGMTIAGVKKIIKEGNFSSTIVEENPVKNEIKETKVSDNKTNQDFSIYKMEIFQAIDLLERAKKELI